MATNRSRRTRGRTGAEGLSEGAYDFYALGGFFGGEEWAHGRTRQELWCYWQDHKAAILARYSAENQAKGFSFAGNRPDYFWAELTEPRLKTGTKEYYKPWPDRQKYVKDVYETDLEYLRRLNLLDGWEAAL